MCGSRFVVVVIVWAFAMALPMSQAWEGMMYGPMWFDVRVYAVLVAGGAVVGYAEEAWAAGVR